MKDKFFPYLILGSILLSSALAGFTAGGASDLVPEAPAGSPQGLGLTLSGPRVASVSTGVSAAFTTLPAYDSGWFAIAQDFATTLTHSLGGDTDDYVVEMQYQSTGSGVNQRYYGGADFGASSFSGTRNDDRVGAYWRTLTSTTITVYRRPEDNYASQIRIRIWVDPAPNWDSGWVSLIPGASATTLAHNLGGNVDHYVVDMQYRSSGSGVNQRYLGGADFGATAFSGTREDDRVGVYWRTLTTTSIALFRRDEDDYGDQVRVRIWVRPAPTFDSGWVSVNQDQASTLNHNLGGDSDDYLVDMQFQSATSGVNQRYYGGADFGATSFGGSRNDDRVGAYWRSLDAGTVTIYRRPEDSYAEMVRIRISVTRDKLYLPQIRSNS